ncbi:MAG: hypothetical protein IK008_03775 [Bacteroidales bacterium]|nr:hypothetical protein [Bacteroidales bacterium]
MNKALKIVLEFVLAAVVVLLVVYIVKSVMKPVRFNNEVEARSQVAIQRLKDIRTLQEQFKSENGHYTSSMDSLILFYKEGKMEITMQIGSMDDSIAVANTEAIKKANRRLKEPDLTKKLIEAREAGQSVVYSIKQEVAVSDTLLLYHKAEKDWSVDSLLYIPFSGRQLTEMESVVRMVSGVPVPLFEARMPYKALCKGLDKQLLINLNAERRDQNKYEGLQVGSITMPNNNAGNWE